MMTTFFNASNHRVILPTNYAAPTLTSRGSLLTCSGVQIGGALGYVPARPNPLPSADVVGELNVRAQRRLLGPRFTTETSFLYRLVKHMTQPFIRFC